MAEKKRRGRHLSADVLEEKIAKAQDRLVAAKAAYEEAAHDLRDLLEKREAIRENELYDKLVKSKWSYDRIIRMLESDPPEDE